MGERNKQRGKKRERGLSQRHHMLVNNKDEECVSECTCFIAPLLYISPGYCHVLSHCLLHVLLLPRQEFSTYTPSIARAILLFPMMASQFVQNYFTRIYRDLQVLSDLHLQATRAEDVKGRALCVRGT